MQTKLRRIGGRGLNGQIFRKRQGGSVIAHGCCNEDFNKVGDY